MLFSGLLEKIEYREFIIDCEVDHITNDSREARSGSVFVCIKGFATDGHLFAKKAYENGCRAFVCEREIDLPSDAQVVIVENSREVLARLSCELYGNPSHKLLVIGITGTKGKTTTALMIKQLLDASGIPCGYIGSNGVIYADKRIDAANTTPESCKLQLFLKNMLDCGIRAVAMEVSSQALKLNRVLGIDFDISLFTNLSPDHIGPGEHDNFEDYFNTKKRLFDDFEAKTVIANADDEHTAKMLADCKSEILLYSINAPSDYKAEGIEFYRTSEFLGMKFNCRKVERFIPCELSIPGEFNVHNALSCLAVVDALGINPDFASKTLANMQIEGRFEVIHAQNGACFVIDYAHNGLSLEASLCALRKYEPSRLVCLFGSVGCRTQIRRTQMGAVASRCADFSILTSDNPATEDPMAIINEIAEQYENPDSFVAIPDRKAAIEYAFKTSGEGDIILLAGKGHEKYQLIGNRKEYFCEREIVEDCINAVKYV
ncbi:MAG: UDP-N-acetylmuramoyl-L-alanyl-D-glutamate--2,6-diaminopimelate ligase [Clostridia bacterium]|nr:UDP-N-acetylmuramoyl-L-alanyl-D-glutamate--2,6-diaminopimelate ligase [Clostridia bacterium]